MKSLGQYLQGSTAYRATALPGVLRRSLWLIVGAFFSLGCFFLFIPWQQTAVGDGRVIAFAPGERMQLITSNVDGRVEKWFVREGDKVRAGDVLAKMVDNDPDIVDRLKRQREAVARRIDALELNVQMTANNIARQKSLLRKEFSSEFTLEQARIAEARAQSDLAEQEVELARLDTALSRQLTLDVKAPTDGVIQNIYVGENSAMISSGTVVAQLVPETQERTVELFMNGRDLPFMKVGQDVRLQFEGWPILQFFTGLPELSSGTFLGTVRIIDASDDGRGNFRLIVAKNDAAPWPAPELLRQGVRTRGWVQMNQVPLWFEVWRQVNDLPPFQVPVSPTTPTSRPTSPTMPDAMSSSSTSSSSSSSSGSALRSTDRPSQSGTSTSSGPASSSGSSSTSR